MATQSESKMVKTTPRWHRARTLRVPREDQDGPTEETRGPAYGTKMATQKQSKMANAQPKRQRVRTLH